MASTKPTDTSETEMDNKLEPSATYIEKGDSGSDTSKGNAHSGQTMTKAVWLACIALGLSYTTAFQQNACTAAIVKHIDAELGQYFKRLETFRTLTND
jgi:hypothetical protein